MSSRAIRNIVQQFFLQPPLQSLPIIYRHWNSQMQLYATQTTVPEQTVAALHIATEVDSRISNPATTGIVMVDYKIQLMICHFLDSVIGDEVADALDDMVESIKTRLRSDPFLGQGSAGFPVFQSAQAPQDRLISVNRGDTMYLDEGVANGAAVTWMGVEWIVTEQLNA